jgi:hypothetical protein
VDNPLLLLLLLHRMRALIVVFVCGASAFARRGMRVPSEFAR